MYLRSAVFDDLRNITPDRAFMHWLGGLSPETGLIHQLHNTIEGAKHEHRTILGRVRGTFAGGNAVGQFSSGIAPANVELGGAALLALSR
jgi:hypothetical protein